MIRLEGELRVRRDRQCYHFTPDRTSCELDALSPLLWRS